MDAAKFRADLGASLGIVLAALGLGGLSGALHHAGASGWLVAVLVLAGWPAGLVAALRVGRWGDNMASGARLKSWLLATYGGAERGSVLRRWFTRVGFGAMLIAASEYVMPGLALEPEKLQDKIFIWFIQTWTLFFFFANVIAPMFLRVWLARFVLAPGRLLVDILLSGGLAILAGALYFRDTGMTDPAFLDAAGAATAASAEAVLYFVIVTFSTLGYGDLQPVPEYRIAAGLFAIYGNIHLGLLAGAAFYALQKPDP